MAGQIDNRAGLIEVNSQNLELRSASLNNQTGTVQHAGQGNLVIQSSGQFNNSNDGLVLSNGSLQVTAASLNNDNGNLRAAGTPGNASTGNTSISVTGGLSNIQGRINAAQDISVLAGTAINNVKGQITAGGQLGVSTSGQLANDEGRIVANKAFSLTLSLVSKQAIERPRHTKIFHKESP